MKFSLEKKNKVIKSYLEGVGIRSIERLEGVSNPLIIRWIKSFSDVIKKKIQEVSIPDDARNIQILELDELFTYCKKKLKEPTFGLLLIETEIVLLTLRSVNREDSSPT